MTTRVLYILGVLTLFSTSVLAQNEFHEGIIKDHNGEVLTGAYVSVKHNRLLAVSTDNKGEFQIKKISDLDTLVISFIGLEDLEVAAEGSFMEVMLYPPKGVQISEADVEGDKIGTKVSLLDPRDSEILTTTELCKAACCNLSEAFETNASVDASFTDAVSGTKQIHMLGLSGKYVQITRDNIPAIRGLSTTYGLGRIPGTWINEIYISKGAGSVVNGFESMTGQINVATFSPETAKSSHLNMYANAGGRVELNSYVPFKVNNKWKSILMIHSEYNGRENDMNDDGFLDMPMKADVVLRNDWLWNSTKGWSGSYSLNYVNANSDSGQLSNTESLNPWMASSNAEHAFITAKTGYVWPDKTWRSVGSQFNAGINQQTNAFGSRDYSGTHSYFRGNLLMSIKQSTKWDYVFGMSYQIDDYSEALDSMSFDRTESVPGVFFENTWKPNDSFVLVTGIRGDYHNLYGELFSPRLHARYRFKGEQAIKIAAGIGYRTPVIIMDNVGLMASNRDFNFPLQNSNSAYGLNIETAINAGISYTNKFKMFYRPASVAIDYYRTEFTNQVVVDRETPGEVSFYNLDGASFSNSYQLEFKMEPAKRLESKFAYRYIDVQTDFNSGRLSAPLVPTHRLFNNTAYKTRKGKDGQRWLFDVTTLYTGSQRLVASGIDELDVNRDAKEFLIINSQVTRDFSKNFSLYVGIENLLNYRQNNPIVSAENPDNELFDASVVYAPIFGRNIYIGFRWDIGKK